LRKSVLKWSAAAIAILLAAPAYADCCDSFLSCAAAVATEGVSCAIENIIATVRTMIHVVETLASGMAAMAQDVCGSAMDSVKAAVADLRRLQSEAKSDLDAAVADAQAFAAAARSNRAATMQVAPAGLGAKPAGASAAAPARPLQSNSVSVARTAVAAPPPRAAPGPTVALRLSPPATRDQVKLAMGRAEDMLLAMRTELERDNDPPIQAATNGALDAVVHALDGAVNGAVTKLTSPLANLRQYLEKLITNPTNLFNPSSYVDAQVNAVQSQVGDVMLALAEDVTRDAKTTLANVRPSIERLQEGAVVARHVADTMGNLARYGTEDALKALNDLLPPVNPSNPSNPANSRSTLVAHVTLAVPTLKMQNKQASIDSALGKMQMAKTHAASVVAPARQSLVALGAAIQKMQSSPPPVLPDAKAKVAGDFDGLFRGKTAQEAEAKKNDLLVEARKRFKTDPGTLRKVEDFINQQTRLRVH